MKQNQRRNFSVSFSATRDNRFIRYGYLP